MNVVLFDRHETGHHLEYAGRLATELLAQECDLKVKFLSPTPLSNGEGFFEDVMTSALSETVEYRPGADADDLIDAVIEYANRVEPDILHFLQIDDAAGVMYRRLHEHKVRPAVAGSINGSFFRNSGISEHVARPLRTPFLGVLATRTYTAIPTPVRQSVLPDLLERNLGLYGILSEGLLDHLFVPSEAAQRFVDKLDGPVPTSTVPDPLDPWFEDAVTKIDAREIVGLPADERILLYFGELRDDKGMDIFLDALREYHGPPFCAAIVGPADDFDAADVASAADASSITVHADVRFVPQQLVQPYFLAADAVVVPYRRLFGRQRLSNVLQKACGACRPIIATDFGVLGRRVRDFDLGITFEPESPPALAREMAVFARGELSFDPESMETYARSQSYQSLARAILDGYHRIHD